MPFEFVQFTTLQLWFLDSEVRSNVASVLEESVVLFAHPRFDVVAGNVVPVNSVVVEVVEYCQAVFGGTTLLCFTVVRLRFADAAVFGPVVLRALVGGCQFLELGSPEPSVDIEWLQVRAFASLEVAETA